MTTGATMNLGSGITDFSDLSLFFEREIGKNGVEVREKDPIVYDEDIIKASLIVSKEISNKLLISLLMAYAEKKRLNGKGSANGISYGVGAIEISNGNSITFIFFTNNSSSPSPEKREIRISFKRHLLSSCQTSGG